MNKRATWRRRNRIGFWVHHEQTFTPAEGMKLAKLISDMRKEGVKVKVEEVKKDE